MIRILVFLTSMLLALPVAAGPAWLCLCTVEQSTGCCCHGDDEDQAPQTPTLDRTCCCGMTRGAPQSAPPVVTAEVAARTVDLPVILAEAVLPTESGFTAVETRGHDGWETGPPLQRALLSHVRLRP